jgi:hypothetical protein
MKWLWPRIILAPSGMISFTAFNSIVHLLPPDRKTFPIRGILWYYKSVKGQGQYKERGNEEKAKRRKSF